MFHGTGNLSITHHFIYKENFIKTVEYYVRDNAGHIVLNRPERHNALNFDLLDDLDRAFDRAEADENVKVIVLKGNGKSFSSGYGLKGSYYVHGTREGIKEWDVQNAMMTVREIEGQNRRILNIPKLTIDQIHGFAIAGGCYLQMLCDISIAAEDAQLGHPVSKGDASSMPLFQFLLGMKKARYLLLSNRLIDGKEAEAAGLVSKAVPRGQLE